jgi:hypothetical protein
MTENKAIGLAPLITPFALAFYGFLTNMSGFNFDNGIVSFITLFIGFSLSSIPVAYLYMFFIGGRLYGIFKRKRWLNFYTIILGSIFIADIPMLLIFPFATGDSFYATLQLFSFVGFMVGLNYWFLSNLDRLRNIVSK